MLNDIRSFGVAAGLLIIAMAHFGPSAISDRQIAQAPGETKSQTVPEEPSTAGPSHQSLSTKLDQSNGVIKPPSGVDPQAAQAPPEAGPQSMPVILPPGSSGSPTPVEPK